MDRMDLRETEEGIKRIQLSRGKVVFVSAPAVARADGPFPDKRLYPGLETAALLCRGAFPSHRPIGNFRGSCPYRKKPGLDFQLFLPRFFQATLSPKKISVAVSLLASSLTVHRVERRHFEFLFVVGARSDSREWNSAGSSKRRRTAGPRNDIIRQRFATFSNQPSSVA